MNAIRIITYPYTCNVWEQREIDVYGLALSKDCGFDGCETLISLPKSLYIPGDTQTIEMYGLLAYTLLDCKECANWYSEHDADENMSAPTPTLRLNIMRTRMSRHIWTQIHIIHESIRVQAVRIGVRLHVAFTKASSHNGWCIYEATELDPAPTPTVSLLPLVMTGGWDSLDKWYTD